MPRPTQLGEALRRVRAAKKMSQQAVAEKAGVSTSLITQVEIGNRNLSADTLGAVAEALSASRKERAELEAARLADRKGARPGVTGEGHVIGGLSDTEYEVLMGTLRALRSSAN